MLRRVLFGVCVLALVASCSSKKKKDDAANQNADNSKISTQDMSMDAVGSDSGKIAGLHSVNFEYDQSRLTAEGRKLLSDNYSWMKANPNVNLQIEGHCDQRGSIEYNLSLGERRAKAVKQYLISLGADAAKLSTISYGKEKLLDSGDSEAAMARNRRANFVPLNH